MKVHATPSLIKRWTRAIQLAFLSSLGTASPRFSDAVIVHGGTALSLAWQGPRHSEDVDMLIDAKRADELHAMMQSIAPSLNAFLEKEMPGLVLDVRIKQSDRKLQCFHLAGSMPDVFGSAKVKLEFWPVSLDYLKSYPCDETCFCARLKQPLRVATLESIYYDKLLALCLREYVKCRDIFDAWWVSRLDRSGIEGPPDIARLMRQAQAYDLSSLFSEKGGRVLIDPALDVDAMAELVRTDMQKWLHADAFLQYNTKNFRDMALHVQSACQAIHRALSFGMAPAEPEERLLFAPVRP